MEEKMRILKMLEEGTITADEAAELMDALCADEPPAAETRGLPSQRRSYDRKLLHIQVTGRDNVNIQFPISAIKKILRITGRLPIPEANMNGIDLEALMEAVSECLDEEIVGDFVNVSAGDNPNVRIYVE